MLTLYLWRIIIFLLSDNGNRFFLKLSFKFRFKCLAGSVNKYVRKGSLLYMEGKLSYRHYNDKDGRKTNVTEIVVDNIVLPDKKNTGVEE